jgi:7,8-dihydroneopterin aldolase/epimerase/oxygenase
MPEAACAAVALRSRARLYMGASCTIEVTGLRVQADIGVYAHEIAMRQPLDVDVEFDVLALPQTDALDETPDYSRVLALADELAGQRIALIETFAKRLAEGLLEHPLVTVAAVRVRKPQALPGCVAGCRVRLSRG